MKIRAASLLLPILLWVGTTGQSGPDARTNGVVRFGPGLDLERREFRDSAGHPTVYYVANREVSGPILLIIGGSGCSPAMASQNGRGVSFLYGLLDAAQDRRFTTMIVEKPYSEPGRVREPGTAKNCSAAFRRYFSRDNWISTITDALREVRRGRGKRSVVLMGLSEGASVAAGVARRVPAVTHVAMISGSGTTQAFDMLLSAYEERGSDEEIAARLQAVDAQLREIMRDPDNPDRWYRGHPYRRWSSFFRAYPDEDLLKSQARVFIVTGMSDPMSPAASDELLYAKLLGAGRHVAIRRLPDAGHDLLPAGSIDLSIQGAEYRRVRDWAAAAP